MDTLTIAGQTLVVLDGVLSPLSTREVLSNNQRQIAVGEPGPFSCDRRRPGFRPIEASTVAVCYVRNTSIRDVASNAARRSRPTCARDYYRDYYHAKRALTIASETCRSVGFDTASRWL
jgi:hypothetical protein